MIAKRRYIKCTYVYIYLYLFAQFTKLVIEPNFVTIAQSLYYQVSKKIYEKLICNTPMNYLSKDTIIYNNQYGFRRQSLIWLIELVLLWILTNFLLDYSLTYQKHLTL